MSTKKKAWISGNWSVSVNGQERHGTIKAEGSPAQVRTALQKQLLTPLAEALRPRETYLDVACPWCGAAAGNFCLSRRGRGGVTVPHRPRLAAAGLALGGSDGPR